jgi:Flp pilus assembly protein protease CpaA
MVGAATWIGDACCVLVCALAAVYDLKTHRIPNVLNLAGFALALVLAFVTRVLVHGPAAGLTDGLVPALGGAVALGGAFFVVALAGAVGMGDVKLMGVVGAFLGWNLAFRVLVDVLVAGAVVALVRGVVRGELAGALRNLARHAGRLAGRPEARSPATLHPMPYALGILLGVSWAVLGRYVPAVRFP